MPAEVGLEAPEMVEVLAPPQEDECRRYLALVSGREDVVHALEQTTATFHVTKMRRRDPGVVGERVAQRDLPAAGRVGLDVEAYAPNRQARVPCPHAPQRR